MYKRIDSSRYPLILKHMDPYRGILEDRATKQARYELQQPQYAYLKFFESPKIIYQVFQVKPAFAFDERLCIGDNAVYSIPSRDLYLLGILNSESCWSEICRHCSPIQNGYQLMRSYFLKVEVPLASTEERQKISELAQRCVGAGGSGPQVVEWEAEINERVAWLYGLKAPPSRPESAEDDA